MYKTEEEIRAMSDTRLRSYAHMFAIDFESMGLVMPDKWHRQRKLVMHIFQERKLEW